MKAKKTLKDFVRNAGRGVKSAVAGLGLLAMVSTANLPSLNAEEIFSQENEDGYRIEAIVDVVPFNLQVQGLEETMGASGEIYGEWSLEPEGVIENYGAELNPIKVSPIAGTFNIPKTLIKPQISIYTPSNIGFHIQAWQFSGSDLKTGEVPGLFGSGYPLNYNSGIVSMWDEIFYSYGREADYTYDESVGMTLNYDGFLDMGEELKTKYECSRDFKLLNGNISASIPVVPTIRAFGGLNFNLFEINDMQKVQPTFHNEYHYLLNWTDGTYSIQDSVYHNNITLEVNSKIKGQGLGPIVGLTGSKNITDWLKVYGNFSKSWTRLKTQRTANFLDIDDISANHIIQEYDSEDNLIGEYQVERTQYIEGNFPFIVEQTHNLSQTELNLGLEFLLGKHVSLSAGYWKNIMQSVPKPAKFHYNRIYGIDDPDLNKLWEYKVEAKDISAQGFTIEIGVRY